MSRRKETKFIVIHSSQTKPNEDLGARDIDEMHRKEGLLKIGYHCIIKRDGTIEVGRPFNEIGAHSQEYDSQSVGVCVIGGRNSRSVVTPNYSAQQHKALHVLIKTLKYMYRDAKVVGHTFDVKELNVQINNETGVNNETSK